jgi:hypothetical protein
MENSLKCQIVQRLVHSIILFSNDVSLEYLLWAKTEREHCSQIGLNSFCWDFDATQHSIDSWPWGDSKKP